MVLSSRRVVITGVGLITPIGSTTEDFWKSLCQGRSGIHAIKAFDAAGLPVRMAGEVPDFDAKQYLEKKDRKSLKVMARTIQLAIAGSQKALEDSGIDKSTLNPTRFGVEFGASLIASELEEIGVPSKLSANGQPGSVDLQKWGELGLANMPPLWMLKYLPNMLACHVAILHNAQGPNNTITESDVASLLAISEAYRILARDQADFILSGGGESKVNPLSMARHVTFQELSRRNDLPEQACRPFDLGRDGTVIGEGAGVLVLEELEHARHRQAHIYAEIIGAGAAFDVQRSGRGLAQAIRAALSDAQIEPNEIDHINAHGDSTKRDDRWEAHALLEVFGKLPRPVPVFAPKSYFGNLGAGGGSTELAASVLALSRGMRPGTLNYEHPDPECPVYVPTGQPQSITKPCILKVSFTDMGQCAAVVLRRWAS
jgi:3-oxoacyl-[acyl-carrier-protein] synthase II